MFTRYGRQKSKMGSMIFYHWCSSLDYVTVYGKRDFIDTKITNQLTLKSGDYHGGLTLII